MKCDPNDHCIVLAVDGTVFCKNCPQKWSPEQPPKEERETPFDGEPVKGRVFTKEEVKQRLEFFRQLFDL